MPADLGLGLDVVSRSGEPWVTLYNQLDIEVAYRGAVVSGLAIPLHPEAHPGIGTRRDMDVHLPLHAGVAAAAAGFAGFFWLFAPAAACRTGGHPDELAEEGLAHLPDLTAPAAGRAGVDFFGLAPGAVALRARFRVEDLDFSIDSEDGVFQVDREAKEEIGTRPRTSRPSAATKEGVEYVSEAAEVGLEPSAVAAATGVRVVRWRSSRRHGRCCRIARAWSPRRPRWGN